MKTRGLKISKGLKINPITLKTADENLEGDREVGVMKEGTQVIEAAKIT